MDNLTRITLAPLKTQLIKSKNSVRRSLEILENQDGKYAEHHQLLINGYSELIELIGKISTNADRIGEGI